MMVICRHATAPYFTNSDQGQLLPFLGWDLAAPFLNGWMGVDLFFVLSGFLIGRQLFSAGSDTFYPAFAIRRLMRIAPAYLVIIALVLLGAFPGHVVAQQSLITSVPYHLMFMQDLLPSTIVPAFWSLGVEMKFYLAAPILVAVVVRLKHRRSAVTVLVLLGLLAPTLRAVIASSAPMPMDYLAYFQTLRSPFLMCWEGLFFGMAIAAARLSRDPSSFGKRRPKRPMLILVVLSVAGIGMAGILMDDGVTFFEAVFVPLAAAVCFSLIVYSLVERPISLGPKTQLIVSWGSRLAYSAYLVHMPLIPLTEHIVRSIEGVGAPQPMISVVVLTMATIPAALLLWYCVERPGIRLGRAWSSRIAPTSTIAAQRVAEIT